jgi:hypothetical protein
VATSRWRLVAARAVRGTLGLAVDAGDCPVEGEPGLPEAVAEFDDEYVWLELREGEKRGLQFAVPLDNGCQEELTALETGENITATLESTNDRNTAWECIQVEEDPEDDRHSIPADD